MLTENKFVRLITNLGGHTYIVGGWVRDHLLGRTANDKDYVVCGVSQDAFEKLFQISPTGHQFPVYLLSIDGELREVALARKERKTGIGYHGFTADFSPDTTITDDLYRRDTRMNSIAMHLPDMKLVDPFNGQADIRNRVIRATSFHFRDDPVRALRAARQAAQLNFTVADDTLVLMSQCGLELRAEPSERIFQEMRKALNSQHPQKFFSTLLHAGLLDTVLPELASLCGVKQPVQYHFGLDAFEHTMKVLETTSINTENEVTRFASLVHDLGKGLTPVEEWPHHYDHPQLGVKALDALCKRIVIPRHWYRYARFIIERHMDIPRTCKLGKIVEILLEMQRNNFSMYETAVIITADHGATPSWLANGDELLSFLNEQRKHIIFPANLPPEQRSAWVKMKLAQALADRGLSEQL